MENGAKSPAGAGQRRFPATTASAASGHGGLGDWRLITRARSSLASLDRYLIGSR